MRIRSSMSASCSCHTPSSRTERRQTTGAKIKHKVCSHARTGENSLAAFNQIPSQLLMRPRLLQLAPTQNWMLPALPPPARLLLTHNGQAYQTHTRTLTHTHLRAELGEWRRFAHALRREHTHPLLVPSKIITADDFACARSLSTCISHADCSQYTLCTHAQNAHLTL